MFLTENQLDEWVRGNSREAQGVIVELIYRLVAASCPQQKERRFPLGDSIGQPGPDGFLNTINAYDPFIPEGQSFWEIGTGLDAGSKATSDYNDRTADTPEEGRKKSAFIFVTPLSARRDWQYTWKEKAQGSWVKKRTKRKEWKEVRVIDGTKLIDWLRQFPSVELWLLKKMGFPADDMETIEQNWDLLKNIGAPPSLPSTIFLINRDAACSKLKDLFSGASMELKLETHFPDQVISFVSAYVADMEDELRIDIANRCVVICKPEAWNAITGLKDKHFLVADPSLDLASGAGVKLIEKARLGGHAIIYGAMPGGIPHPNSAPIPNPKEYQIQEALKKAGYIEERARTFAQKSGGNLGSLLRCLQNLSLMPEWTEKTLAAELAIAEVLGGWDESSQGDKTVAENLSGKAYGEWIGAMREVALYSGTPLIQRDTIWKFIARYEGWYALGPRLFDEHLDRLKKEAVSVLGEIDPKFELSRDDRFAASLHGKVLSHSQWLRKGLAESLALLGSHSKALSSCSAGRPEAIVALAVREILSESDWLIWASVNDQLPLLAEAAPDEFLNRVELTLKSDPCPFDEIFAQEDSGVMGWNYMTGLLWALETLAWDEIYLTRVIVILGELAARDPGGNWANRPSNSLITILLPWMPQTCAPIDRRISAVATLMKEFPEIAWKMLLGLLPSTHQISTGTRRPAWRELIPENWSATVTHGEYDRQIETYLNMTLAAAKDDLSKLANLIDRLEDLPMSARDQLIEHLGSDAIVNSPEESRLKLWDELIDLISRHMKFSDTDWAMKKEQIDRLSIVAERLAPMSSSLRYRRLFSERDFDLYEGKGDWDRQAKALEVRRQKAVEQLYAEGGTNAVIEFAEKVESPWRIGIAFGIVGPTEADKAILPKYIDIDNKHLIQFAAGFIKGRFNSHAWSWVDRVDTADWSPIQIGQFLAFLPFGPATWERAKQLLLNNESMYWSKTNANPYETEEGLEMAIDHLLEFNRPNAALRCLHKLHLDKHQINSLQATKVLLAIPSSSEIERGTLNIYEIIEIIKALQENPDMSHDDLFNIEWLYMRLLDRHSGASPKLLENMLAEKPEFYCEVIRLVYRSKKEEKATEVTEAQNNVASNAYHLLHSWRIPPGLQKDGSYNGEALSKWVNSVKEECVQTGHLEVAMLQLGHVLIHVPPDPDGLWIHHSVASVLNAKDAKEIRDGFTSGLFNSRGVHIVTEGKEELKIAADCMSRANDLEAKGYQRFAASIRNLAKSYEQEAEREKSRDFGDY